MHWGAVAAREPCGEHHCTGDISLSLKIVCKTKNNNEILDACPRLPVWLLERKSYRRELSGSCSG